MKGNPVPQCLRRTTTYVIMRKDFLGDPVMLLLLAFAVSAPSIPDEARLTQAVYQAIVDEIDFGNSAVKDQDMDRYMESVPDDYRIVEDDSSITDKAALRAKQAQAWALIRQTNSLDVKVTDLKLGCGGDCAFVSTDQTWDRQMTGKDGVSEFNVVTTQKHDEKWELRGGRWVQTAIEELGGTTMVDGKPY